MNLADYPLVVTVWHQPGCGHCEEFLPRLEAFAEKYGTCVPTLAIDATQNERIADALAIDATPTVIVLRRGTTLRRFPRGLEDEELERLYESVAGACQIVASRGGD